MKNEKGKEYVDELENEDEENELKKKKEDASCAQKSEDLSEDDLEKSIAKLEEYFEKGDAPSRKQTLLEKAQVTELSKSEQDELHQILGGGNSEPEETLSDIVEKSMEPGEDLQKALDVSEYLSETHEESVRVNRMLADTIEKSDSRQHEYNMVLAKAMARIGNLVKSLDEKFDTISEQPARRPKSQVGKPLQKSFAGAPPAGEQLSKSEISDTLETLFMKSCDMGQGGAMDGIDLLAETAKFETTNRLNPAVMAMVMRERSAK